LVGSLEGGRPFVCISVHLLLLSAVDVEDGLGEGLGYFVRQGVTDVRPLAPARAATRTPQQSLQ
jgi:hypothetical protein